MPRAGGRGPDRALVGTERTRQRAVVAQVAREATGVDPGDPRDVVRAQQVVERTLGRRQLLGRRARSRTITPEQNGRRLSSSSALTP